MRESASGNYKCFYKKEIESHDIRFFEEPSMPAGIELCAKRIQSTALPLSYRRTLFVELCFIEPKARAMHQQVHSIRSIQSTIKVDSTLPLSDRRRNGAATSTFLFFNYFN